MITKEDEADIQGLLNRLSTVSPTDMTFEEGMYIIQYLTASYAMRMQGESERASPDVAEIDRLRALSDDLMAKREQLIDLWTLVVGQYQKELSHFTQVLSAPHQNPQ